MQRRTKVILSIVLVLGLVTTGIVVAYELGGSPSACSPADSAIPPAGATSQAHDAGPLPAVVPAVQSAPIGPPPAFAVGPAAHAGTPRTADAQVVNVVAAENFWGSLVGQIGGVHVHVTTVITNPNTDPHEYESNDSTAVAFKQAQYVILNNVGYDDWANALLGAEGATNRTVLNIGNTLGVHVTGGIVSGNPHLWYNPAYVDRAVAWMYQNLTAIAPGLTGYFTEQYDNLTASLGTLYSEIGIIHQQFAGTPVASTESLFVYLANATGLNLVSPPAFMEAVAVGSDPPDRSVVQFQCQLESGHVRVLVVNAQTVTPLTTDMQTIAQAHNVSVVSVTETIVPPSASFQVWMGGELHSLYAALDANALGS